jgi:phenylalanyl-tRNA synthetase beta chain
VPGLLKALHANRNAAVREGLRLFEVSDVMLLDAASDVGARNERRLGALYTGPSAGFEVLHGLVDRIMRLLEVPHRPFAWCTPAEGGEGRTYGRGGYRYYIEAADSPSYFPGRGASIVLESEGGGKRLIGTVGVLHPSVLTAFELSFPCAVAEMNIEPFVEEQGKPPATA